MKHKLSALIDAEHTPSELDSVCAALNDPAVRRDWSNYSLIGAALRAETRLDFDISAQVMAALAAEPTVLAPQLVIAAKLKNTKHDLFGQLSALAAGLAGVALVAWMSFTLSPVAPTDQIALAPVLIPTTTGVANQVTATPKALVPSQLQDYVVAHQAHTSVGALVGGSRNVRAVSASRGAP